MDMIMNDASTTPVSFYLWICGRRIRVYSVSPIVSGHFRPDVLAQSLRFYRPLPYPFTWYVYGDQAAVVNMIDLHAYEQTHQRSPSYSHSTTTTSTSTYYQPQEEAIQYSETVDDVALLQDLNMDHINESFEQAPGFVACSGLTKKLISKNLRVTTYREESDEVCVVCQVEFEKKERVGMLECRHRFHPNCIKEWLLRKNVCPVCKAQALKV